MTGCVSRRRSALVGVCLLAFLPACGSDDNSPEGAFGSPEECVEALVDVSDGDVTAAELVERCGVSAAEAEVAVPARPTEESDEESDEVDSEPAAETTTTTTTTTTAPAEETEERNAVETTALMPDIPCGTDLQLAQDLVQEAGVFKSRSVDATGEGRFQVMDRNWVVVRSEPPAGTPIEEDDPVFYVVKDEEFAGC